MTIVLTTEHHGLQVQVLEEKDSFNKACHFAQYFHDGDWKDGGCLHGSVGDALFEIREHIDKDLSCAEIETQFTTLLEALRKKHRDRDIAQALAGVLHKIHLHPDETLVDKVVGALENLDY